MSEPVKEIPLTENEKSAVWSAINHNMQEDDEDPRVVIDRDFGGKEDDYLRVMARCHSVPIGS